MEKTIAVVVTYNREKLLANCINALRNQSRKPDQILVVNNGSTDDTEKWLSAQNDIVFISQENFGSAGGFSSGIDWAYKNGYSWIWCMDDDGYPAHHAFENLLKADDAKQLRLLNCIVVDKEDKDTLVWKTGEYTSLNQVDCELIHGKGHLFNGTLLHRKIIERVGLPNKNFFLWGDETEYYYRITRKNNIPVATVANSVHYHPSTAFSLRQDWDFSASWKMYFYVRNRLHVHKAKFRSAAYAYICYFSFIVAFMGVIVFLQKTNRRKKLQFMFWPATDALFSRFETTPGEILNRLKLSSKRSFFDQFKYPFPKKYIRSLSS
ncbi:MAG: glycosyltransferase family 2 protein [Rhizobacter sp.]|nr:glycosyltransferase family 2 protein [Ferruginibacter sp.]